MRSFFASIMLALTLLMASCSSNQVLASLEAVTTTASLALPLLSSQFGLDTTSLPKIRSYLQLVNRSTIAAANILEDRTLSPAQKSLAITVVFSRIAAPELPDGTPKRALELIEAVSGSISNLLATVNKNPVQARAPEPPLTTFGWANSFAESPKKEKPKPDPLTKEQVEKAKAKVEEIRQKARRNLEALR